MECVTSNPNFDNLEGWYAQSEGDPNCSILLCDSSNISGIIPPAGRCYAMLKGRKKTWNSIAQNISAKLKTNTSYSVKSHVRFRKAGAGAGAGGEGEKKFSIKVTMYLKNENDEYWHENPFRPLGSVEASDKEWKVLEGEIPPFPFLPPQIVVYVEGPPAGIDLLVGSLSIYPKNEDDVILETPCKTDQQILYGVNIIKNGDFSHGVEGWKTMTGGEKMTPHPANPIGHPNGPPSEPSSLDTLSSSFSSNIHSSLSGATAPYLIVSNRKAYWQGPKQEITDRVVPFVTYAVYAWVRVGLSDPPAPSAGSSALVDSILRQSFSQEVNFALSVNDRWVNGGYAEAATSEWRRLYGSFRVEEDVRRVIMYFQGPLPDVDVWIADVRVFAVNGLERVEELKERAERIRKRNVRIQITNSKGDIIPRARVKVKQSQRKFPLGSCMNSRDFNNPSYLDFFRSHFNFAVFENELKWTSMEKDRGKVNYELVDKMLTWNQLQGIPCRAHCIFWDNAVPAWAKNLSDAELASAVDSRIVELISRYRNNFVNYDVNNEMLHGGYFANRLGIGTVVRMFQLAKRMDENASFFLNDYHVEDGKDAKATPHKYASQARNLLARNAPVGGLGVQGHLFAPVGLNIRHSLDLLRSEINLPVWFTEVDVVSKDEMVRADDLEIVLREVFAHEGVEGVLLWGFWQGGKLGPAMSRKDAHLVNSDWTLNECGRRFESLVREWTTPDLEGWCDENGVFEFRGYLGKYTMEVLEVGLGEHRRSLKKEMEFKFDVDAEAKLERPCCVHVSI